MHAANVKYNFPKSTQFEENICYVPTQRRNEYTATSAIDGSITDVLDLMKHHHLTHFLLYLMVKYVILLRFPK